MTDQSQPVYPTGSSSVAVELLRTGTPYNQNLSPSLTYLALCGDNPPADFQIKLEQFSFNRYLRLLRYNARNGDMSIQQARSELQAIITRIFDDIPALQEAEFRQIKGWLHLRLVMTPLELTMLPFELVLTPKNFQDASNSSSLLNAERFTTITREVRQVTPKKYTWPAKARILFVWAAPENTVPASEHLERLKSAILPWVCPDKNNPEPEADYSPLLTELPEASLSKLQAAIQEAVNQNFPYTHVHILAHGTPIDDPDTGPRFALALHLDKKRNDFSDRKTDAVDGDRLAAALLLNQGNHTNFPAVVTIAACDSGNEGTNLVPGGSLAQVLHQSGVPYVLASQFPLSKTGSIRLVEDFYPRLLQGEDPRMALYFSREAVVQPDIHDWASLIAYARFPDDFDQQLKDVQLKAAFNLLKVANSWSDYLLETVNPENTTYNLVEERLNGAITKLENLLDQNKSIAYNAVRMAEHYGLLGSAYKRLSEHRYRQTLNSEDSKGELFLQSKDALQKARNYYQQGHDLLLTNHWTGVQYLSLAAVLAETLEDEFERWSATKFAAENDLQQTTGENRIWALGSLAELYLLKPFIASANELATKKAVEKAGDYLDELNASGYAFAKESTARQLERYVTWWPNAFTSERLNRIRELAKQLLDHLPPPEN
ncbi:CHAT domain-containing protein [Spirosoma validum]|uniref:CHAT domain-containing protein n=1 Tax=Spirosoma validum TaxID=2771355 RepID=A0A927B127_9BACT|nr:CHAT domain-containing protein [Spirosoma validum]MBD2753434.1 CHAT domain-containing protein [Spirosoma validum]